MKKLVWAGDVDNELVGKVWKGGWSKLILCSDGGCIYSARAVCDYLLANPKPVLATGRCFSAATAICVAAETCLATPGTRFMVHEPSVDSTSGGARQMKNEAEEMRVWLDWYLGLLADRTHTDRRAWHDLVRAETYLSAAAARDVGLIDGVT